MRRYAVALGLRVLVLGVVLGLIAAGVIAATDEAYSTTPMRAARLAAVLPAIAAFAVLLGIGRARSLGELRALEALGAPPVAVRLGGIAAGWLLGVVALVLLGAVGDPAALFPAVSKGEPWRLVDGVLVDPWGRASLGADGALTLGAAWAVEPPRGETPGVRAALVALTPLALVAPAWSAAEIGGRARLVAAAVTAAALVVGLHALAAGQLPAALLAGCAAPLAAQTAAAWARSRPR